MVIQMRQLQLGQLIAGLLKTPARLVTAATPAAAEPPPSPPPSPPPIAAADSVPPRPAPGIAPLAVAEALRAGGAPNPGKQLRLFADYAAKKWPL